MNRNDMLKAILVVGVVLLFFVQYAGMIFNNDDAPSQETELEQYVGITIFEATIDYYERALYASNLNFETSEALEEREEVREISLDGGIYKISLKKKEDVVPLYEELKLDGIDSFAVAKIILQPSVELNGMEGYFYNRKMKLQGIEPVFELGSTIQLQGQVIIQGDQAIQSGQIDLYSEPKEIVSSGNITKKEQVVNFIIPWENRENINLENLKNEYGEDKVLFEKNNQIVFIEPLSTQEQIDMKFDYVEYIGANTLLLEEGFLDMDKIKEDYSDNVIFPDSNLIIKGNETELNYTSESYQLLTLEILEVDGYFLREEHKTQNLIYSEVMDVGIVNITINAIVSGNNILDVEKVDIIN